MKNLFISLINSKTTIGVCSLTTKKDNKVMWSLYGDTYKGYCIEYDEVKDDEIVQCLKPVIYSKKSDNDVIITMIKFTIETLIRDITMGKAPTNIGVFDELVCTKDSDWSFQDEWRIVATSKSKVNLKANAVYLGFDVTKDDEDKVVACAKRKSFKVFKMKKPTGSVKIEYIQIC